MYSWIEAYVFVEMKYTESFPECDVHSIAYDMDTTDTKQITQVFFEMKAELEKLNKVAKTEKENKQIHWWFNYEQDKSVNLSKFLCSWNLQKKQWKMV